MIVNLANPNLITVPHPLTLTGFTVGTLRINEVSTILQVLCIITETMPHVVILQVLLRNHIWHPTTITSVLLDLSLPSRHIRISANRKLYNVNPRSLKKIFYCSGSVIRCPSHEDWQKIIFTLVSLELSACAHHSDWSVLEDMNALLGLPYTSYLYVHLIQTVLTLEGYSLSI